MTTFADQSLEDQIAQWREYLHRRQAFHGSDIEELEGHLRDQLTALTDAGLTGEEAFLVAVKRMGSLDELSRIVSGSTGLEELLAQVATSAARAVPGADGAGVTLLRVHPVDRIVEALAASTQFVSEIDDIPNFDVGVGHVRTSLVALMLHGANATSCNSLKNNEVLRTPG